MNGEESHSRGSGRWTRSEPSITHASNGGTPRKTPQHANTQHPRASRPTTTQTLIPKPSEPSFPRAPPPLSLPRSLSASAPPPAISPPLRAHPYLAGSIPPLVFPNHAQIHPRRLRRQREAARGRRWMTSSTAETQTFAFLGESNQPQVHFTRQINHSRISVVWRERRRCPASMPRCGGGGDALTAAPSLVTLHKRDLHAEAVARVGPGDEAAAAIRESVPSHQTGMANLQEAGPLVCC